MKREEITVIVADNKSLKPSVIGYFSSTVNDEYFLGTGEMYK